MSKSITTKKDGIIDDIIALEFEMLEEINSTEPCLCKDRPELFNKMRKMVFIVLSNDTLLSYRSDLINAKNDGKNLLYDKYARMDNLIPTVNKNENIGKILEIETQWIKELITKCPGLFKGDVSNFKKYLSSELSTYSDITLNLYLKDIQSAVRKGKNLIEARYSYISIL